MLSTPAPRIAVDGLWRCLCPSIDAIAFSQRRSLPKIIPRPSLSNPRPSNPIRRLRTFHTSAVHRQPTVRETWYSVWREHRDAQTDIFTHPRLAQLSTEQIFDVLEHKQNEENAYEQIVALVRYLVQIRHVEPETRIYEALLRANADAVNGDGRVVEELWEEMRGKGVKVGKGAYHAALMTLTTHPNFLLRARILREMKERWVDVSAAGWHDVVISHLRDKEYEMALDRLEKMESGGVKVEPWLYDIVLYVLADAGELDEALRILKWRFMDRGEVDISLNIWYYLLDTFSSAHHFEGTSFIYNARVSTSHLNPSDGILTNVLNLSALHRAPALATSCIQHLSARNTVLAASVYESLLHAYTSTSDYPTAFRVLSIMAKAGHTPCPGATRPLYLFLSATVVHDPSILSSSLDILKDLDSQGHKVPTAAVNVIIEAAAMNGMMDFAIQVYRSHLPTICGSPNIDTFNALLQGCSKTTGRKAFAMSLAADMVELNIRPDALTYDRLMLVCLGEEHEDYEDAFGYLEEMGRVLGTGMDGRPVGPRQGTWVQLVRRCAREGDGRAWAALEEMGRRGMPTRKLRRAVEELWGEELLGKELAVGVRVDDVDEEMRPSLAPLEESIDTSAGSAGQVNLNTPAEHLGEEAARAPPIGDRELELELELEQRPQEHQERDAEPERQPHPQVVQTMRDRHVRWDNSIGA